MNTLLLTADDFEAAPAPGACARVHGERARHLIEMLDATAGGRIRVGLVDHGLGWADVISCGGDEIEIALAGMPSEPPPPKLPVTLVVGLTRPKAARRLLFDAAAAGVERIILLGSWRAPKSYWQSPLLQPDAIARHLTDGIALAGDCSLPRFETRHAFKPFAEDELPTLARDATTALVASPTATERCEPAPAGHVVLCIGPDRGFTDYEVDLLIAAGCRPVSLGARTLRVHSAVHVGIGRLF